MSEAEPQFLTLKERKAALLQQQASDSASPHSSNALIPVNRANKRPPPPPPAAKLAILDRPLNNLRTQSVPNGSVISTSVGNMPAKEIAPPPILDRAIQVKEQNLRLSERNLKKPPPLPGRKFTAPMGSVPNIPQRKPSDQLVIVEAGRKPSTESLKSTYSNHSTLSYGGNTRSSTSSVNTENMRRLPPPLNEAELPILPPSKRELEEKLKLEKASRASAQTSKSTSCVPRMARQIKPPSMPPLPLRPSAQSRPTPPLPSRPSQPSLPNRPTNGDNAAAPPMPTRPRVNHGITGFSYGVEAPPPQPQRPSQPSDFSNTPPPAPIGPAVIDLTPSSFDSVVMSGRPALVFFHLPYCKYCKPVFAIYDELGASYQYASNQVTICKVDGAEHTSLNERFGVEGWPTIMWFDGRGGEPDTFNMERNLDSLTRFVKQKSGGLKPGSPVKGGEVGAPPPIPTYSRPSAGQIEAIRARQAQTQAQAVSIPAAISDVNSCLVCRDFSAPDATGAQYPRQSIPRGSAVDYLAHHLCSPFASQTDKARAIFTWCHHNIDYDFVAFLAENIKHQSAEEGIRSGLGVCENYASIFCAIAVKADMECVVVGGHGKGYGHTERVPGQPIPAYHGNHAWNAVRIDGGRWKLIDACWGAGHLGEDKLYHRQFSPEHFCGSNIEFGLSHFPEKPQFFYREDSRSLSWEEYYLGPPGAQAKKVQLYNGDKHGISKEGVEPKFETIDTSALRSVRFKFETLCPHWDFHKNGTGDPYLFCLRVPKKPGMEYCEDLIPMDFDPKAKVWWLDVEVKRLGKAGEEVAVVSIDTVGGKDARGLTKREYPSRIRVAGGLSFGYVAKWVLA